MAPSVDFMLKQSYPRPEEEDPSKFMLPMPQSIRVNLGYRGALRYATTQCIDQTTTSWLAIQPSAAENLMDITDEKTL